MSYSQEGRKLEITASGTPIGGGVVITNRHVFKDDAELQKRGFDTTQPIVSRLVGCYAKARQLRFSLKLKKLGWEDDIAIMGADLQKIHETMPRRMFLISLFLIFVSCFLVCQTEPFYF